MTEGTQFWAAQLEDERFDAEIEKQLEEVKRRREQGRPSLVGYNRLISALDELTDHIHMLRAESGRWDRAPRGRPKPKFPIDRIEERKIATSRGLINAILEDAHALARPTR